ncbi:large ribosomal subunit protein mL65 [Genypterus blacodes]|uniref:large ribosomal subunit protein mL65 n=1 Tax=Genypterus blacodes TaxID=154954 RepID=UPI003F7763E9
MATRTRLPLQTLLSKNSPALLKQKCLVHAEAAAREPAYPPIVASLTAKSKAARLRQIQERVSQICAATVEDKISLITRVQRKKFVVYPQTFARNADRWYQHFTKTAYISGLPDKFTVGPEVSTGESSPSLGIGDDAFEGTRTPVLDAPNALPGMGDDAFEGIRTLVVDAILQEHWYMKKRKPFLYREQEHFVAPFLKNLVTGLTYGLSKYNPLLSLSSVDLKPKVNFYWRRGETTVPRGHRRGNLEPTRFQIDDQPHSQIRITRQLSPFTPMEASYAAEVPEIKLAPNTLPLFRRQYENNMFTGAKFPDPAHYGHTQFHMVPDHYHRARMARRQQSDQIEVFLRANGLASLFAWTGAQAMYQGFWNHEDVSRPFASQAVITDGQFFSFFCYQLNTVALSVETDANNPRKNLLWGTESMRLYEAVQDGEVVGLNDGVIKLLIQFLMNRP